MKYLFIVLCIQIYYKECTVDIRLQDYVYLSDHLTAEECRLLFASLRFTSYDLSPSLAAVQKKVPHDVPCIKLLLKWNSGKEKWEGMRKTHTDVEHRLRQIGRNDLADWLGRTVFHNLVKNMNNTLVNVTYYTFDKSVRNNLVTEKGLTSFPDEWTAIDSMLWVLLMGILGTILIAFCRILHLAYRKAMVKDKDNEEMVDLLSIASVESDVDETIYEFRTDKNEDRSTNDNTVKS